MWEARMDPSFIFLLDTNEWIKKLFTTLRDRYVIGATAPFSVRACISLSELVLINFALIVGSKMLYKKRWYEF